MIVTNELTLKKEVKHSKVFEPKSNTPEDKAICSGVYISKTILPKGATECRLTVEFPPYSTPTATV